jgi:hypothetical protein
MYGLSISGKRFSLAPGNTRSNAAVPASNQRSLIRWRSAAFERFFVTFIHFTGTERWVGASVVVAAEASEPASQILRAW